MSKPGKRGKSGEVEGVISTSTKGEHSLSSCALEEETWSPCVAWVVGRQPEDFKHIEALNIIIQTGTRKLFSVITKEQLYLDVRELGNPKNKKGKDVPPFSDICESCKVYLDANQPIPVSLVAKLIKWKMLILKDIDMKRRAALAKASADKKKGRDKEQVKSPKKPSKKSPESSKEGVKLKKRGEDDDESKFIDDEPEDGAQYYFIVTGFHEPRLFQYLDSINIFINCIIAVSSQEYFDSKKSVAEVEKHVPVHEEDLKKEEELKQELHAFWRDLLPLLQRLPDTSTLHDIAKLEYEVKSLVVPTDPLDAEQKVQYSTAIFDDIAMLLYSIRDAKRLYLTYLTNLKLTHIPLFTEKEAIGEVQGLVLEKSATPAVDMRYYNDLMNTIPQESVSVALIVHCMLEQIVATEEGTLPCSEQPLQTASDGHGCDLSAYLSDVASKLGLSFEEHEMLSKVLNLPSAPLEKVSPPKLINVHDAISVRTQHLKPNYGFDAQAVEEEMLRFLPFANLCQVEQLTLDESRQRAVRLQELLHYCSLEGLSKAEIDHAFKQFVFESIHITKCDRNGFPLKREKEGFHQRPIPWDDPYPFYKIMLPTPDKNALERLAVSMIPSDTQSGCSKSSLTHFGGHYKKTKLLGEEYKDEISQDPWLKDLSAPSLTKLKYKKYGGPSRISDVILEVDVTLGTGACKIPKENSLKQVSPKDLSKETVEKVSIEIEADRASMSSTGSRRGILVASTHSLSRNDSPLRSTCASVHFDVPSTHTDLDNLEEVKIIQNSPVESLLDLTDTQQRNLEEWIFAEQLKPHILLQVLQEASYQLPFVETYAHKRDQSVMLILHNPFNRERQNIQSWHSELHSNMGFRNYLENVAESIQEWLKMKEAQYKAHLLSKEVESIVKEEEEKNKVMEKTDKREKRSPQKSPSRLKSPKGSASNSQDRLSFVGTNNPYIRVGSLKAQIAEQKISSIDDGEKDKIRLDKRKRSSFQKQKDKPEKEKERRFSAKSSSVKSESETTPPLHSMNSLTNDVTYENTIIDSEPYWPFHGYDTGNKFIHVSGTTSNMFPSDGGTIKTERTEMVQGSTFIKSVVQKDEHVFAVHIINPREDMNLPEEYVAELEANYKLHNLVSESVNRLETPVSFKSGTAIDDKSDRKTSKDNKEGHAVSQFGSVTAHLSDGMILALSQFGPTGESYLKPYEPSQTAQFITMEQILETPSASPTKSKTSVTKNKMNSISDSEKKSVTSESQQIFHPEESEVKKEKKDALPKQDFQELFVTCPDGLTVKYFLQSSVGVVPQSPDDHQLVVKQSYPFKTTGVQSCESSRNKYIQSEVSRIITADGSVIKNMVNGSVEILSADGTVSTFTGIWTDRCNSASAAEKSHAESSKKDKKSKYSSSKTLQLDVSEVDVPKVSKITSNWVIKYPGGKCFQVFKETGHIVELPSVPGCIASDPETKQVMTTREDHVVVITYPDGGSVVEHADGTRISVYYREVTVSPEVLSEDTPTEQPLTQVIKFVKVECPAFATVEFNTLTTENLTVFGNGTSINVFPDGYYMLHHYRGGKIEIDTKGTVIYFPRRNRFQEHLMPQRELQYVLCHNADVIVETVDPDGNIFNVHSSGESSVIPFLGDDIFSSKSFLSNLGEEMKNETGLNNHAPRFFIINADGSGTELLRYCDVADYLLMAERNPATAVLREPIPEYPDVTGITILKPYLLGLSEKWFKKYDRDSIVPQGLRCRDLKTLPPTEYKKPGPKFGTNVGKGLNIGNVKAPVKIPILKCPEKLEFRQLIQYKPITNNLRTKYQNGLHEYARAVIARMQAENLMNVKDPRSEYEQISAENLQSLVDLNWSEVIRFNPENVKQIYEGAVAPPQPAAPSKPKHKRTAADWEKDKLELQEEARDKKAIRNKIIEPYFECELGKVFQETKGFHRYSVAPHGPKDAQQDNTLHTTNEGKDTSFSHADANSHEWNSSHIAQMPSHVERPPKTITSPDVPAVSEDAKPVQPKVPEDFMSQDAVPDGIGRAVTTSGMRPHNPTPAHAAGLEMYTTEPNSMSHKAPHFAESPTDEDKKASTAFKTSKGLLDTDNSTFAPLHSLTTNVLGEPRKHPVQLPSSLKGGKSGAHPNVWYQTVEEPVRRKLKTASIVGATSKGLENLSRMKGLIYRPQVIDFGTLKEGFMYSYKLQLQNTGFDACRFKVRQPSPATGLRVGYTPGPVAAGMSTDLNLELYAIATGMEGQTDDGRYYYTLQITTEADLLEIPVIATILTADDYDNPDVAPNIPRMSGAQCSTKKPPLSIRQFMNNRISVN